MAALDSALKKMLEDFRPNPKDFWGNATGLSLGVGLLYKDISFPIIDPEMEAFDTVSGNVFVLTHECDVSQENQRFFNEEILICPIIPFADLVDEYIKKSENQFINGFLPAVAKNLVNRVTYVPPVNDNTLPHGGIMNFNNICSTHISLFKEKTAAAAASVLGLDAIDIKLRNHIFRPKNQNLPLALSYSPGIRTT